MDQWNIKFGGRESIIILAPLPPIESLMSVRLPLTDNMDFSPFFYHSVIYFSYVYELPKGEGSDERLSHHVQRLERIK